MIPKLRTWMQNLLYPAFLGTFLVAFFDKLSPSFGGASGPITWNLPSAIELALWAWTLLYFGSLYVETETTRGSSYDAVTFVLDLLEIICMATAVWSLKLWGAVSWAPALYYMCVAIGILLPIAWRFCVEGRTKSVLNLLCLLAIAATSIAAYQRITGKSLFSEEKIVACMWTLLGVYYFYVLWNRPKYAVLTSGEICTIAGDYEYVSHVSPDEIALERDDTAPNHPDGSKCHWVVVKVNKRSWW